MYVHTMYVAACGDICNHMYAHYICVNMLHLYSHMYIYIISYAYVCIGTLYAHALNSNLNWLIFCVPFSYL